MNPQRPRESLDAYLDGLMDPGERAEFKTSAQSDSNLASDLRLQTQVDDALRRLFPAPAGDAVVARVLSAGRPPTPARRSGAPRIFRLVGLAVAASVVISVGYFAYETYVAPTPVDMYAPRSIEAVYRDDVRAGFKPLWVCKDDREFANTFRERLGEPLLLGQLPPALAMSGLSYANSITPQTVYMLATADGKPVIVFVDRVDAPSPQLAERCRLRLFSRRIGELALYELTPLEAPRFLDHFFQPPKEGPP